MIHSISSADNASRPCLSPRPIAAKKPFTIWTFSWMLIEISPFPLHRIVSDLIGYVVDLVGHGVGDSADIDVQGYVPAAGAVLGQADHHQAERLERLGHV